MDKQIKIIAFYLPQFHTIPENDLAHGDGFTEWTNVKKATPLFEGHLQPRIPYNKNYYCLLDDGVMQKQAELARRFGVYGFCYYHYWFNGRKLLEKPVEKMLKDRTIDIPFCLCWANENWTKRWDGGNNEIIVEQSYGDMNDIDDHVDYLCSFFEDNRYIKIDGKPIFIIYRPDIIPDLRRMINRIRKRIIEHGYPGVILISQYPQFFYDNVSLKLFDYYIQFQPHFLQTYDLNSYRGKFQKKILEMIIASGMKSIAKNLKNQIIKLTDEKKLEIRSYDEDWNKILNYKVEDKRLIAGAFPDWDNTPRDKQGIVYKGSSPVKFGKYMKALIDKVKNEYATDFIFVNAWNEWAEGAILEPDEYYGYGYLEALKKATD